MGAAASVNTSSRDLLNYDDQSHRNVSEEISPDSEDSNVAEMYMNYARKDVMHKVLSNAAGREAFMRFLSVECQEKKLISSECIENTPRGRSEYLSELSDQSEDSVTALLEDEYHFTGETEFLPSIVCQMLEDDERISKKYDNVLSARSQFSKRISSDAAR